MTNPHPILVVDDDRDFADGLSEVLVRLGYETHIAHSAEEAGRAMGASAVRLAFVDLKLAAASGLQLIASLKAAHPDCLYILMTAYSSVDSAVEAVHVGAYDYLRKPFGVDELKVLLLRAVDRLTAEDQKRAAERELASANEELREINHRLAHLVTITRRFAGCADLALLYPQLLAGFAQGMGAGGGSLYLVRPHALELEASLDPGHAPAVIPLPLSPGSVMQAVLATGQPALVEDISADPHMKPSGWNGYGDASLVAFPLFSHQGEVQAIVSLHSKGTPPFTRIDLDLGVILSTHVTETLRATAAFESLASSERRYRDLVDGSVQGICVYGDGRVLFANASFLQLLGCPHAGHRNGDDAPRAKLPEALLRAVHDADEPDAQTEPTRRLVQTVDQHDHARWIEAIARQVHWEGRPALQITAVDVTARIEAEDRMRQQQRDLVQADRMAALGTLVSSIAHEINNPINLIGLNVSLIERIWADIGPIVERETAGHDGLRLGGLPAARIPETIPRLVGGITDASERVQHIVRRVREFSQQRQEPEHQQVDVNAMVDSAIELVQGEIRKSTHAFEKSLAEGLPPVRGDRIELAQVVVNLIGNSCQALTSEHGAIHLRTSYDDEAGAVVIEVEDQGSGIEARHLSSVFDPFFTTKRERGGTGLGLFVSYGIIKEHSGRIELESTPGQGTRARVVLPAAPDA